MTKLLIPARHARMFGKARLRKRRARSNDQIMLDLYDKMIVLMTETEHDLRLMAHKYPPALIADLLAAADETRREFQALRLDILSNPRAPAPTLENRPIRPR